MMKLEDYCGGKIYIDINEASVMLGYKICSWQYKQRILMGKIATKINTFIDIGACLGYFTLYMAKNMNDNGRILSFEPHHENHKWLNKSIEKNGYKNIKTFKTALSNKDGETKLFLGKQRGEHSLIQDDKEYREIYWEYHKVHGCVNKKIKVKCNKLDTILKKEKIIKKCLVKIDVEGAELSVLEGMEKTIEKNPNIIIIIDLHPMKKAKKVFDFLYNRDFYIFSIEKDMKPISDFLNPNQIEEILATKKTINNKNILNKNFIMST